MLKLQTGNVGVMRLVYVNSRGNSEPDRGSLPQGCSRRPDILQGIYTDTHCYIPKSNFGSKSVGQTRYIMLNKKQKIAHFMVFICIGSILFLMYIKNTCGFLLDLMMI